MTGRATYESWKTLSNGRQCSHGQRPSALAIWQSLWSPEHLHSQKVRTELKTVFEGLNFNGNRYSIKTPITEEEKGLFESSVTQEGSVADKAISKILKNVMDPNSPFIGHFKDGWMPSDLVEDMISASKVGSQAVIKSLKEQGYLEMANSEKIQRDKKRRGCYNE
jgi:hypothetical protein